MKRILQITAMLAAIGVFAIPSAPQTQKRPANKATAAIRAVLDAQAAAWNNGDVTGYMDGYERSEQTVMVSGDSVIRGWQTIHDRYQRNYNSREKMGTLSFSDLEITHLGSDSALVIGRWHLKRATDEPHGRFSLVFRRTKKGWKIIHDHTSSAT
jgi:uncharacterized protein (TIGR02246 family)